MRWRKSGESDRFCGGFGSDVVHSDVGAKSGSSRLGNVPSVQRVPDAILVVLSVGIQSGVNVKSRQSVMGVGKHLSEDSGTRSGRVRTGSVRTVSPS